MSKRAGARNGAASQVATDVAIRLRAVRALWLAVQNDPRTTVADVATEFYYAVGEILEGKTLRTLTLRNIDRERVLAHAEE